MIPADAIYDILVSECGASESWREEFRFRQQSKFCSEFRFQGNLGFGGKFRRKEELRRVKTVVQPVSVWVERWYVTMYPEDAAPARQEAVQRANDALQELHQGWQDEQGGYGEGLYA